MSENGSESNTQNPGLHKEDALGTIQGLFKMPVQGIFWLRVREAVASARDSLACVLKWKWGSRCPSWNPFHVGQSISFYMVSFWHPVFDVTQSGSALD